MNEVTIIDNAPVNRTESNRIELGLLPNCPSLIHTDHVMRFRFNQQKLGMGGTHGTHGIPRYQISRYQYRGGHGIPSRSRYFTVLFINTMYYK